MATLIGREAWHIGAVLSHGKIVAHHPHIPAVELLLPGGERKTVHASQALLNIDAALREAEEAADYWTRKVRDLQAERDGDGDRQEGAIRDYLREPQSRPHSACEHEWSMGVNSGVWACFKCNILRSEFDAAPNTPKGE